MQTQTININKIPFQTLYWRKLENALLYECAARLIKNFWEEIYQQWQRFSEQDRFHAIRLNQILLSLHGMNQALQEPAMLPTIMVDIGGIKEDENGPSVTTVTCNCCDLLMDAEREIWRQTDIITENMPEVSNVREILDVGLLGSVAESRQISLADLKRRVIEGVIFQRASKHREWRCEMCGYVDRGAEAPETCACCGSPQSWQTAASWMLP